MKKRFMSAFLAVIMLFSMLSTTAFAASSEEEALGEINIFNGGVTMSYLSINGRIREQIYTYYNRVTPSGAVKEIPAYCVNPNDKGVPQTVGVGESIKYLADEKAADPKVTGIIANGYPNRGLSELGLENKYHAYYATKMALWCYLLSHWDINNLKVNPNLTGLELERAQKILAAAKDIYRRGTTWTENLSPNVSCTPDRDVAYEVTVNGRQYKQQVFTEWENQLNAFDRTIYMGCNDLTSAKYFAEKCGKVTISVTNNQFPLMPLFSPVYSSTRPYSQTRSNTQRDLLQADEFLRLDRYKCVVMFNHYKPAHLYKIMLEELPEYKQLRKCSVFDYEPEWKSREEAERQRRAPEKRSDMEETESPPNLQQSTRNPDAHGAAQQAADPPVTGKPSVPQRQETGNTCIYDIPSMKNATPESIGLVEMTRSAIISSDDPELEEMDDPSRIPPGRGI